MLSVDSDKIRGICSKPDEYFYQGHLEIRNNKIHPHRVLAQIGLLGLGIQQMLEKEVMVAPLAAVR